MFKGFGERSPQRPSIQEDLEHLKDELRSLQSSLSRIEEKIRKGEGDVEKLEQEKQRLLRLIEEMKRRIRNKEKDLEAPETLDERVTRKIEGEPNVDQDERDRQEREARFDD
ncbi:hypothetical protein HN858_05770 [Candidatus Falkowbacteria bacterium]|jgi:chromosome segregation ATPase|nr:hypothetical protein [Candidatus Falkowbacteria bacterium]MBT5502866.1 hypothetical protein [Candidatus Falkowbacteria bacterium]MBT6573627.1 hypothetical protein [Candidatus Falkowbacteria bacterium]MBT7349145.1 hypothetical protein [Candidatus Falkowbacteria bacterium]MBT7500098.1 hypothetical protein [Candidatus Falkowbacteria bacterium]